MSGLDMERVHTSRFNAFADVERQTRRSRLSPDDQLHLAALEKEREATVRLVQERQADRRPQDLAEALDAITRQHAVLRNVPRRAMADQTRSALEHKAAQLVERQNAREIGRACEPHDLAIAAIERKAAPSHDLQRSLTRAPDAGLHRAFARSAAGKEKARER